MPLITRDNYGAWTAWDTIPLSVDEYNKLFDTVKKTVKEEHMFASRKDEDGTFRLTIRRGRVIHTTIVDNEEKQIIFPSYNKSKACSDELNETCLVEYDTYLDRDNILRDINKPVPDSLRDTMIGIIKKHGGIT